MHIKPGFIAETKIILANTGSIAQPKTTLANVSVSNLLPVLFVAVLGLVLIFAAGFAETEVLHSAAHDARHSAGFPCH